CGSACTYRPGTGMTRNMAAQRMPRRTANNYVNYTAAMASCLSAGTTARMGETVITEVPMKRGASIDRFITIGKKRHGPLPVTCSLRLLYLAILARISAG